MMMKPSPITSPMHVATCRSDYAFSKSNLLLLHTQFHLFFILFFFFLLLLFHLLYSSFSVSFCMWGCLSLSLSLSLCFSFSSCSFPSPASASAARHAPLPSLSPLVPSPLPPLPSLSP